MSQHDLVLDNGSGAAFRADANNALAALGSTMKGPNAPPAPIAGMLWWDDDTPSSSVWTLKIYDGAEWSEVGTLDTSANVFRPASVPAVLLPPGGSIAAPAYSFSGDTDTGIYSSGANTWGLTAGGAQRLFVDASQFRLVHSSDAIFSFLPSNASASVNGISRLLTVNESSFPVAEIVTDVRTDGSSDISFYTTPWGSRTVDRRAIRMTIPGAGPVVVNSGGLDVLNDLRFNSGYGYAALAYGVRAWVNFNGTGTVAIRASGGVTSITDNGTGDYTVNFNFTMPDANYAPAGITGNDSGNCFIVPISYATTNFRFNVIDRNISFNNRDQSMISLMFVR